MLNLPKNLFELPSINRTLGTGSEWGCLILGSRRHGDSPDTSGWNRSRLFALNLLLSGSGTYVDGTGRMIPLQPGSVYHHFPGTKARVTLSGDPSCSECFLLCDHDTFAGLNKLHVIPDTEVLLLDSPGRAVNAFLRLRESCDISMSVKGRRRLTGELILFLSGLYEKALQPQGDRFWEEIVRRAAQDLGENLADRIHPQDLARRYHVSYPSFRRAFRRIMRVSPGEYRIRQRIDSACALLASHPVKDVAERLGYCDPFTFSIQFKKFTGTPPSEFRIHRGE